MTLYEIISIVLSGVAFVVSLISVIFVFIRVRMTKKQLFLDNYTRILEINRNLLTIGFNDKDLFDVLDGKNIKSSQKQKRYIQLWINQIDLIFYANKNKVIDNKTWLSFESDITDFLSLETVRKHWNTVELYYGEDLRKYINRIIESKDAVSAKSNRLSIC